MFKHLSTFYLLPENCDSFYARQYLASLCFIPCSEESSSKPARYFLNSKIISGSVFQTSNKSFRGKVTIQLSHTKVRRPLKGSYQLNIQSGAEESFHPKHFVIFSINTLKIFSRTQHLRNSDLQAGNPALSQKFAFNADFRKLRRQNIKSNFLQCFLK